MLSVDVSDGEFTDDDCTDTVSDQDPRDGHGEGECTDDAVDGEGCINYFKEHQFADVRFC